MSTPSTSGEKRSFSGLGATIDAFIVVLAVAAAATSFALGWLEFSRGFDVKNTALFAFISVLLVVTEAKSTVIVRHVTGGVVTPSWAFAFTLMLLGSPTGAIIVMAVATTIADTLSGRPAYKILFNVAQISLSLALGGLVLIALGIRGPLFTEIELPTYRAIAMILSGVVVFGTNGIIISRLLAWLEGARFLEIIRGKFLLSMTSDAAMLAIAPIFLITAKNNLLMLPLMGTATFFVYQTAQNALRRTHEANHDPLTGLLNRRAFTDRLNEFFLTAPPDGDSASVWILDLDRFKEVNDRLGHQTGDHVLQEFGRRLVDRLPATATVARLGGDEFAVMIPGTTTDGRWSTRPTVRRRTGRAARRRWISDLSRHQYRGRPLSDDTVEPRVSCSTRPMSRCTVPNVSGPASRSTDRSGKPRRRVASPCSPMSQTGSSEATSRWSTSPSSTLRPAASSASRRCSAGITRSTVGSARANSSHSPNTPTSSDRSPTSSSPESIEQIAPIDGLRVAINVSARNLEDRHFASGLLERLGDRGFAGRSTRDRDHRERCCRVDPERTSAVLDELRAAGVRVSIDDFGTGYSSFGTLRDITVDRLKIDRSLVRRAAGSTPDRHIVKAMIELAHGLGLDDPGGRCREPGGVGRTDRTRMRPTRRGS